MMGSNAIVIEL